MAYPRPSKIRKGRKSVFRETGLDDDHGTTPDFSDNIRPSFEGEKESQESTRRASDPEIERAPERKDSVGGESLREKSRWLSRFILEKRPKIKSAATAPPASISGIQRFTLIALLIAVVLPTIGYRNGRHTVEVNGADAAVIREPVITPTLENRADSRTDVCKRWAGQSKYCRTAGAWS